MSEQLYPHQPHQPLPCRSRARLSPLSLMTPPRTQNLLSKSKRSHEDIPKTTIACPPRPKLVVNRQSPFAITRSPAVKRRSSRRAPHYTPLNQRRYTRP
ncbi:hypothetical protein LZ30DRAFT_474107 [Colletotrichum cereale]|nr:hypothetical protein LZ30DRAFT_474107 [Colletotrichum cereale]